MKNKRIQLMALLLVLMLAATIGVSAVCAESSSIPVRTDSTIEASCINDLPGEPTGVPTCQP